jgi:hypothetical protein
MSSRRAKIPDWCDWAVTGAFVGGGCLLYGQLDPLENTFNGGRLFFIGCVPGVAVGILLGISLVRLPEVARISRTMRVLVVLCSLAGLAFATASLASWWNIHGSQGPPVAENVHVFEKSSHRGLLSGTSYSFDVKWRGQRERLRVSPSVFEGIAEGSDISVSVAPGKLGFPHVTAVHP